MALISTKGMNALNAVYTIYSTSSFKPVQSREIAQATDISQNYLEQILLSLKKAKILKSTRGVSGGYTLGKDAGLIKIKDIFKAVEKEISIGHVPTTHKTVESYLKECNQKLLDFFEISLDELYKKYKQKRTINYTTFGL
jgi:Rrf2 family protein